jgi:hypothetical protein
MDIRDMLTGPIFILVLCLMCFTAWVGHEAGRLDGEAYAKANPVPVFVEVQDFAQYGFKGTIYE